MKTRFPLTTAATTTLGAIAALSFALCGCATTYIKPDAVSNPPPKERLSNFEHFEIEPVLMEAPYAGQEANEKALKKIQENLDTRLEPLLTSWNAKSTDTAGRTLQIKPRIQDIKFVNATSRVWGGAFAGSSAVIIKVRFIDKASGDVIAEPEFYQRAAAMGGAYSFGATDNNMLVRIAELVSDYIEKNYAEAVGGPTGAPEEQTKRGG